MASQMTKIFYPSTKTLQIIRRKAEKARSLYEKDTAIESYRDAKGWYKSPKDPMDLLTVFKRLSLKQKYVLRAYVFSDGGNGNGIVWGMPENSSFPEPDDCEKLAEQFLSPPKPARAINFEDVLIGNGRPWSYLEASLFIREAREFGAQWHGCFWSDVRILDRDPFVAFGNLEADAQVKDWEWKARKPKDWRPRIIVDKNRTQVCFYTYNPVGGETINLNEDVYVKGLYCPEFKNTIIAQGPGGFVY